MLRIKDTLWHTVSLNKKIYRFINLNDLDKIQAKINIAELPFCLRIVLESNLRHCKSDQEILSVLDVFADWQKSSKKRLSIKIFATRVLLQDYTGIPVLVDLCALRQVAINKGIDSELINPKIPIDLVIDHSIVVNVSGNTFAEFENSKQQYEQNMERFSFLKWVSYAFNNLKIIPPDSGICHQVNLESLATCYVLEKKDEQLTIFPELVIGADSHTTTINSLGVLGWGVGGIEALGASLGEALDIQMPEVIGLRLSGHLQAGVTATDCVLTVTALLRSVGVINKFVEFFGPGVASLSVPDRATLANMAPEYGATCAFFPWDEQTIHYLGNTGRDQVDILSSYARIASLWNENVVQPKYSQVVDLDLGAVEPRISGPKRPEDIRLLSEVPNSFRDVQMSNSDLPRSGIPHGAILLAAITSCTNTSNPNLMISAGLLAKKAVLLGLNVPSWVKTLFAPGSLVVGEYLQQSGLQNFLNQLGFNLCGYGCTACIGNSGPLLPSAQDAIKHEGLVGCAVLSGNRNFSGRVQQQLQHNYLASPPLVVAFALAGKITVDLNNEPISNIGGVDIFLKDIWPTTQEVDDILSKCIKPELFNKRRKSLTKGSALWEALPISETRNYDWQNDSGFVKQPPFFKEVTSSSQPKLLIKKARIFLLLGDNVTTDDISPAGRIQPESVAGKYLLENGISSERLHTFGARRGNWEVMLRGAFTNPNLVNEIIPQKNGGFTKVFPDNVESEILAASVVYQKQGIPLLIIAGKNYGTGSSRDDAARSTQLLGIVAVIAESYERIHRSNLAAFGVMPLLFQEGDTRKTLNLDGTEIIDIFLGESHPVAGEIVRGTIERVNGEKIEYRFRSALRLEELPQFNCGGFLPFLAQKVLSNTH